MKDWDSLYEKKGIIQKEPSIRVIKAVKFFKQQGIKRILDLGCGTGRHTILLLKENFEVYGCDSSERAIKIIKETLNRGKFEKCDMVSLPYENNFFGAILCHQVIQHGKMSDIKKAISEMYRILKKEGILFLTVISTKHSKYLTGQEIEPNTRINTDSIDGYIPHHFFTENEMNELFKNFKIIKLRHLEWFSELEQDKKSAAWELYARKPKK